MLFYSTYITGGGHKSGPHSCAVFASIGCPVPYPKARTVGQWTYLLPSTPPTGVGSTHKYPTAHCTVGQWAAGSKYQPRVASHSLDRSIGIKGRQHPGDRPVLRLVASLKLSSFAPKISEMPTRMSKLNCTPRI